MKTIDSAFFLLFHLTFFLSLSLSPSPMGICCGLLSVSFNPLSFSLLPPPLPASSSFPLFLSFTASHQQFRNMSTRELQVFCYDCELVMQIRASFFPSPSPSLSLSLSLSLSAAAAAETSFLVASFFTPHSLPPPHHYLVSKRIFCLNASI